MRPVYGWAEPARKARSSARGRFRVAPAAPPLISAAADLFTGAWAT